MVESASPTAGVDIRPSYALNRRRLLLRERAGRATNNVVASGEVGEHAEKRKGASDECGATGEDRSACFAVHRQYQLARLSRCSDRADFEVARWRAAHR